MGRRSLGRVAAVLVVVLGALVAAVPAWASGATSPSVSSFAVSPTALPAGGGYVTFSADIVGGLNCTFSSHPALPGLPATAPCDSNADWPSVSVPPNSSKEPKTYSFSLEVTPLAGFATKSAKAGPASVTVGLATYVALGDSYSSGEANPPFTNTTGCDVSQNTSWPIMTAAKLKLSSGFHDIACSGAQISDLTEPWAAKYQPAQTAQLASYSPSVATVTIGGNSFIQGASQNTDWGFADVIADCYEQGVLNRDPNGCSTDGTIAKADGAITSSASTGLQARLTAAYKAIHAASPSTKLLVVGYPDIVPPSWSANTALHCLWLGPNDISGLNQIATDLNATVQAAAHAAGVPFVSTLDVMARHTLCTAKSDIESITVDSGVLASSAGHPLPPGQKAMAKAVEPALNGLEKGSEGGGNANAQILASDGLSYCKVLSTGGVDCWGNNTYGELGNGTIDGSNDTPQPVIGITNAVSVAADDDVGVGGSGDGYCAVLSTGGVDCWGYNGSGQLGNGTIFGPDGVGGYDTPQVVTGISTAVSLEKAFESYCAVLTSGGVDCWGDNSDGQLGTGQPGGPDHDGYDTPQAMAGITNATSLASGISDGGYCAVLSTGGVDCWGDNYYGQLGNGTLGFGSPQRYDTPQPVIGITNATTVASSNNGYCAVLTSGGVDCWGLNNVGQLGVGTLDGPEGGCCYDIPQATTGITDAVSIAPVPDGDGYCAVLSTGGVDCWGENYDGQLGNGTTNGPDGESGYDAPQATLGITDAASISANYSSSGYCAVLSTGGVNCWGDNTYGELGNGTTGGPDGADGYDTSQIVTGITSAVSVTSADYGYCAVLTSGGVDCWGDNSYGELGNGTISGPDAGGYDTPQAVSFP